MILRGWMVMLFGVVLGATAGYLVTAFIQWDLLFFVPEGENEAQGERLLLLLSMVLGGCFGGLPFISWSVDLDMQNKYRGRR